MKKGLYDLTIEEFTRLLCDMPKPYTLEMKTFPCSHLENDNKETIKGTYEQLYDVFTDVKYKTNDSTLIDYVKNNLFDYNLSLSILDIYNYLDKITNNFEIDRCRIVLDELDMWHTMVINEERINIVNSLSSNEREYYKIKSIGYINNEKQTVYSINYVDAYSKIFGFAYDFSYNEVINILKSKIKLSLNTNANNKESTLQKELNTILQSELNTDRARKYIAKAIEANYIKKRDKGLQWLFGGNRGKVRLGYFIQKVYCPNHTETIPEKGINALFGVDRIGSAISQIVNAKKPQKWKAEIDKLFE